ncbi:MAG: short-chain dehydrogenase/reductase, partial [Myxococcaceae bacterium]|nr:short-chain dehydrogenase/reductase [Myxococcaceae bacterium]
MTKLQGKVVAVTGAGSGMGRAIGCALVARGAHVALSDVNAEGLRETAELIQKTPPTGTRVSTHVVDVSDWSAMQRYASEVEAQHGGADILINNAGVAILKHFDELPLADLAFVLNVNLWGVIHG